jgi:septal ring-binding cell division protein DamX
MRFEIRTGGMLLILVGLAMLSGAVFALGLIAGYEMSRQNQIDQSQLASVYPAPSPVALPTAVAPAPAMPAVARPPAPIPAPSPVIMASHPAARPARPVSEEAIPPPPVEAPPPPPPGEETPGAGEGTAPAAGPVPAAPAATSALASVGGTANPAAQPSPAVKRRPFNIQIDAVMDYSGAQQMARRLRQLGYQPTIVQTQIAGQTWYRLRIGPYATAEEARAAQEKLRQQYKTAFGGN